MKRTGVRLLSLGVSDKPREMKPRSDVDCFYRKAIQSFFYLGKVLYLLGGGGGGEGLGMGGGLGRVISEILE